MTGRETTIICSNCRTEIILTEAIARPIADRLRKQYETEFQNRLEEELKTQAEAAQHQARAAISTEIADLRAQIAERENQIALAQEQELELRKQRRELDDQRRSFDLELARRLDAERQQLIQQTLTTANDDYRLKEAEKDKQIADLRRQIDTLRLKAEQGSQQLQGEVLELSLEDCLRSAFPNDLIEPIAKGVRGADVLQTVRTASGTCCGKILWESKRTKAWSDQWTGKLKDDLRAERADLAVLITTTLPKDVPMVGFVDGIWVATPPCFMGLGMALRSGLLEVAETRRANEGTHDKMELLYQYLSGNGFKQRVQAIVETFAGMREDLEQEKRSIQRAWAKREKQIERVVVSTVGLHGDVAGIIGADLARMPLLEMDGIDSDMAPSNLADKAVATRKH